MKIKDLFESQSQIEITNEIKKSAAAIVHLLETFDIISFARGWQAAETIGISLITEVETRLWYYKMLASTNKMQIEYNKLLQLIEKLRNKIKSGV